MEQQLNLFDFFSPVNSLVYAAFPSNEFSELEYKSAKNGFPDSFWSTYSAFANTNGGFIVLGINEKKGYANIEGLEERSIHTHQKTFWDIVNNPNKINKNIMANNDVKEIEIQNKRVLVFRIPAATRTEKPIFLNGNPFKGNTYKRDHEGDYKCSDDQVRRMIADADTSYHPDGRILDGFTFDDIDLNSLKRYKQLLSSAKPNHVWLSLDDIDFLKRLGAYRTDRLTKKEGFTVAGLLMFGKGHSIVEQDCTPSFFPDYRENLSNDPKERWTDRIYPDGTWESNLLQFYLKVWPKLTSGLPKPFKLEDGVRKDETPAHIAIREAFINTLVHADYTASGSIIIQQKIDGFVFSNPGTLLVSIEQYYHGGISECRNTILQKMFMLIGSAEKAGSGVNKIMQGWESSRWRRPYLGVYDNPDRVELELLMFSILGDDTLEGLYSKFGSNIDTLSEDELLILATCYIEDNITNNRLQYTVSLHRVEITKVLQELCKKGYLIQEGKSRWTTYHLNDNFNNIDTNNTLSIDTNSANIDTNIDTSTDNSIDTNPNKHTKYNIDTKKANRDSAKKSKKLKVSKRLSKQEIETLILNICKEDYRSSEYIAETLGRSISYLKSFILPTMIKEGMLIRRYPNIPHHPSQRYKSQETKAK